MWRLWLMDAETPSGSNGAPSGLCRIAKDAAAAAAPFMPFRARRIANLPPKNPSCET